MLDAGPQSLIEKLIEKLNWKLNWGWCPAFNCRASTPILVSVKLKTNFYMNKKVSSF